MNPVATMVGVVVDANRMHLTKAHWAELLTQLGSLVERDVKEFHTADFYAGNGIWHGLDGNQRSSIISLIFKWLSSRKHGVVYASVVKQDYQDALRSGDIPEGMDTLWRFMGFHMILAMQRHCQRENNNKGNTMFIFDNQEKERANFGDLILRPPAWSDEYYALQKNQGRLDQVIDVPVFADSKHVGLLQVADCLAFVARRHAEIKLGLVPPKYSNQDFKVAVWMNDFAARTIPRANIYPKQARTNAHDVFYRMAPSALRDLS